MSPYIHGAPAAGDQQEPHSVRAEYCSLTRAATIARPAPALSVAPSGHRESREPRGRQMPAPARRQGSRRAIQETPYSPNPGISATGAASTTVRGIALREQLLVSRNPGSCKPTGGASANG